MGWHAECGDVQIHRFSKTIKSAKLTRSPGDGAFAGGSFALTEVFGNARVAMAVEVATVPALRRQPRRPGVARIAAGLDDFQQRRRRDSPLRKRSPARGLRRGPRKWVCRSAGSARSLWQGEPQTPWLVRERPDCSRGPRGLRAALLVKAARHGANGRRVGSLGAGAKEVLDGADVGGMGLIGAEAGGRLLVGGMEVVGVVVGAGPVEV